MAIKTRMDSAGRIVIPKELRERYGFDRGTPLRIIPLPDGVSIVAEQRERRFIRIGPVLAIDTGADSFRIVRGSDEIAWRPPCISLRSQGPIDRNGPGQYDHPTIRCGKHLDDY